MAFLRAILIYFPVIFFTFLTLSGCEDIGNKKDYQNTPMYDLTSPKLINLPQELDEISGIAYYAKDTSVFAITDEDNFLFKISLLNPKNIEKWPFDKKRDYEDIVLVDSTFYVLVSNGDIVTIKFKGNTALTEKSDFGSGKKKNEFESLYALPDSGKLLLMCKDCETDKKSGVSTFLVNLKDSVNTYTPGFTLNMEPVNKKLQLDKHLKPSAAAIHPITGDLYVLSTIQSLLIIASPQGEVKEFYKLDKAHFKQAEGIAFTPEGNMIISNEFGEDGFANLLLFRNKLN